MGMIAQHIASLDLNVDVAWIGSHLHQFIHDRTQKKQPSLFFNWTPNTLTALGNYTRVKFPLCVRNAEAQHCDYDVQQLSKIVWSLIQSHAPEAYQLIQSMHFTQVN